MFRDYDSSKLFFQIFFLSFVVLGTYNAVVINEESEISTDQMKFVKRLDESYGVITPGRMVAASTTWKKLSVSEMKRNPIVQVVSKIDSSIKKNEEDNNQAITAAIGEELNLALIEVINPKKWKTALTKSDFSGSLATRDGLIENLSVSLPSEESISISFAEMSGNVFEYDRDGEIFSGMIYQVDPKSYMITLTNGPLEGTRLKFSNEENNTDVDSNVDTQELESSQSEEVVAGNFGEEISPEFTPDEISQYDRSIQEEAVKAQSFKF
jgi:hypothetical protein